LAESERKTVRFPKAIRHRKSEATIYGKSKRYPFYRVVCRADGKRRMKSVAGYSDARRFADKKVRELAKGSKVPVLTDKQAGDALAALQRLQHFYQSTGRRISFLAGISEYCEAAAKLGERPLSECVDAYLRDLALVNRKDISETVEEFIEARKARTLAPDGRRPQLSAGYHYNVSMWLREFAATFPGHAVSDLTKEHLSAYMAAHGDVAPKTRNERRNVIRMFLKWAVRQDYLSPNHRLRESDALAHEQADTEEISFYSPKELRLMLETASKDPAYGVLVPVITLSALAGVRLQEAVRLTWEDVFRVPGHIEISKSKSKTRSRRLVTICPALAAWIEPYRAHSGLVWNKSLSMFHDEFGALRDLIKTPAHRNGLRHGFVRFHFALNSNENLTAAEARNSPAMVHKNYKGLAAKAEAEQWFNVTPAQGAENVIPWTQATMK
jgi:integrase